jgi:hypothetical protein
MKCGKNKVWSAFPGNVFLQIFRACPRFMFLILFVYASNVSFVIPKASRVSLLEQSVGSGINPDSMKSVDLDPDPKSGSRRANIAQRIRKSS